jgi:glycosyltransferase involved in cell wall biosynthesis
MPHELVSVIIPTFNRAGLLPEALESIFSQGWPALQVIVVDDGSTDHTPELIASYGSKVEYTWQPNQGAGSARNRGLELARGSVIAFLDSDDLWLPQKLRVEMALLDQFPEAGAVFSDSEHWLRGELVIPSRFTKAGVRTATGEPGYLRHDPPLWVHSSLVSTCCMTIRRSALARLTPPRFDDSRTVNEDWDLEVRLYYSCEVVLCPRILAIIRRVEDNTRIGRAIPGMPMTVEQRLIRVGKHRNVLLRALELPELPASAVEHVHAKLKEITAVLDSLEEEASTRGPTAITSYV